MSDLTRPIIEIENRTPQEVFDIMCDRIGNSADAGAPELICQALRVLRDNSSPEHIRIVDALDLLVAIQHADAPSSPGDGWVMVPREPTDEMLLKGHHQIDWGRDDQPTNTNDDPLQKPGGVGTTCKEDLRDAYRAMLSAAPSPGGDHGA